MVQSISTYIAPAFTLTAGATANVDVRLTDIGNMQVSLEQTWAATGSTTGVAVNLIPGFGGADPAESPFTPIPYVLKNPASPASIHGTTVPVWSTNFAPVTNPAGTTAIAQPVISTGTPQTTRTAFYLNSVLMIWPQWVSIQIINLDASNNCTIFLRADI